MPNDFVSRLLPLPVGAYPLAVLLTWPPIERPELLRGRERVLECLCWADVELEESCRRWFTSGSEFCRSRVAFPGRHWVGGEKMVVTVILHHKSSVVNTNNLCTYKSDHKIMKRGTTLATLSINAVELVS